MKALLDGLKALGVARLAAMGAVPLAAETSQLSMVSRIIRSWIGGWRAGWRW